MFAPLSAPAQLVCSWLPLGTFHEKLSDLPVSPCDTPCTVLWTSCGRSTEFPLYPMLTVPLSWLDSWPFPANTVSVRTSGWKHVLNSSLHFQLALLDSRNIWWLLVETWKTERNSKSSSLGHITFLESNPQSEPLMLFSILLQMKSITTSCTRQNKTQFYRSVFSSVTEPH